MVPKRSKTPGSEKLGSAARRRRRSRASGNVTSPPQPAGELTLTAKADVSSDALASPAERTTPRLPSVADVTASIENERVELLQIQAMLKCLYEVLLYADDDDSVMHADVANVCARLINESVRRLGDLLMQGCGHNEFDESAASESCGSEE